MTRPRRKVVGEAWAVKNGSYWLSISRGWTLRRDHRRLFTSRSDAQLALCCDDRLVRVRFVEVGR